MATASICWPASSRIRSTWSTSRPTTSASATAADDTLPRQAYLLWTRRWLAAVARVLAPDGSLPQRRREANRSRAGLDVARVARRVFTLQNTIHWIKSIAIDREAAGGAALDRDLAVGHYKPINSARFVNDCHEYVFHFTRHGATALDRTAIGVPYQDKSNVTRWAAAGADLRCRGNTWFLPYDTIKSRDKDRPHPATFPPRLPEQCIRLHGRDRVRLVVDPFAGLGARLSPAPASTSTSPASTWTTCTWPKRSAARFKRWRAR